MDAGTLKKIGFLYIPIPFLVAAMKVFANMLTRGEKIPAKLLTVINFAGVILFNTPMALAPLVGQPRFSRRWARASHTMGAAYMVAGFSLAADASLMRERIVGGDVPEELIQTGIYAYMRHPTYAGVILTGLGWSILRSSPYALGAIPLQTLFFYLVARIEESEMLVPLFGMDYEQYRDRTPFFSWHVIPPMILAYLYGLLAWVSSRSRETR